MGIWLDKNLSAEKLKPPSAESMGGHLGIEWVALGEDFITARMPVNHRTLQPEGILHGGASCALAETVGNTASNLVADTSRYLCLGVEINANHIRPARRGFITATARPLHLGVSTHVWDIRICDEEEKLICISRLTVAILKRKI